MQVGPEELRQRISSLTTEELHQMLTIDREQYREIAIAIATEELRRRTGVRIEKDADDREIDLGAQDFEASQKKSDLGSILWGIWAVLILLSALSRSRPNFLNDLLRGLTNTFGEIPVAIVGGVLVLPLGRILFAVREKRLMLYAWLELVFGVCFAIYTIWEKTHGIRIRAYNPSDLATWMALGSSVYIVVRGFDNRKRAIVIKREASKSVEQLKPQDPKPTE
ncbi:MAG: hypothetical protein WAM70_00800 [Pyrinomonadaceae bacterium]